MDVSDIKTSLPLDSSLEKKQDQIPMPNPALSSASSKVFSFLEEWYKLDLTALCDISSDSRIRWSKLSNKSIEDLPGIQVGDEITDGSCWFSIERLTKEDPPIAPAILEDWVVFSESLLLTPTIKESIEVFDEVATQALIDEYEEKQAEWDDTPEEEREGTFPPIPPKKVYVIIELDDSEDVQAAWDVFLNQWEDWAEREAPRRKTIALYHDLFSYRQTLGEGNSQAPQELVWGVGMTYRAGNKRLRFPLISLPVEFADTTNDLSIRIVSMDRPPTVNIHALLEDFPEGAAVLERQLRSQLSPDEEHSALTPFDIERLYGLLKIQACEVDSSACFAESQPERSEDLTFTMDWVVMVQERSVNYMLEDVQALKAIADNAEVPPCAMEDLVIRRETPYPDFPDELQGFADTGTEPRAGVAVRKLYFPKPYNSEQVEVVRKLETSQGVVLQGPPGTGKTHTIANIVTHYLAMGKRVLVTSHKTPALRILKSQLPEGIQMLTGLLLENDREGKEELESSVNKITSEVLQCSEKDLSEDIANLRAKIDRNHKKLLLNQKLTANYAHQYRTPAPDHLGGLSPRELAQEVASDAETYSWFPDELDTEIGWYEDTLDNDFFCRIKDLRKNLGEDLHIDHEKILSPEDLPTVEQIGDLHKHLGAYRDTRSSLDSLKNHIATNYLKQDDLEVASSLLQELAAFKERLSPVDKGDWQKLVALCFHSPEDLPHQFQGTEHQLSESLCHCLDTQIRNFRETNSYFLKPVCLPTDDIPLEEIKARVDQVCLGNQPYKMVEKVTQRKQIRAFQTITLKGAHPSTQEEWIDIQRWIDLHLEGHQLAQDWNLMADMLSLPPASATQSVEIYSDLRPTVESAQLIRELDLNALQSTLESVAVYVQLPDLPSQLTKTCLSSPQTLTPIIQTLDLLVAEFNGRNALQRKNFLLGALENNSIYLKHFEFIENQLGEKSKSPSEIESAWRPLYARTTDLHKKKPTLVNLLKSQTQLKELGALNLSKSLVGTVYHAESDDSETLPPSMSEVWLWAKKRAYLKKIDTKSHLLELNTERLNLEKKQARGYEDLAVKQTWLKLKETFRMQPDLVSSLKEFVSHIKKVGRGTGKLAPFHRAQAQKALKRCDESIRCWIMPQWRVSESLPAKYAMFDLVIIDEASQSDLKALPAIARGHKVLIVGDDKQVSPIQVGTRAQSVTALYHRFLKDLPYGASMTIKDSIYDVASIAYGASTIRLREHFRCVEPIISFSSKEFYDGEIKCLRVPTAEERLSPVLIDVYLEAGIRDDRKKINEVEATYIVQEIKNLTEETEIGNRSIGVVSLLGNEQSKLIWERLMLEIPEESIIRHHIRCGDSSTFQGSEFDIVFLSMVNHERTTTLTGDIYQQRYNVAASRARDRMYLCRSIAPEMLKPEDLRAKLIQHFTEPDVPLAGAGREECESPFEEEVFDFLADKGYMVSTQVAAAGFRIDLVVEDAAGRRLAIECDGYIAHPEHKWADDMCRQKILERAGWTFHRIWGPSYYRDKDASLEELLSEIKTQGIEIHHGGIAQATGIVELRQIPIEKAEELNEGAKDSVPDDGEANSASTPQLQPSSSSMEQTAP